LGFFKIGGKPNVVTMSEIIIKELGINRNLLANFLIIGLPIVLARFFLDKSIVNILGIFMVILATGLTYSRTAYGILIISFIIYLFISKRAKLLPILVIFAIGSSFYIAESIIERASKGVGTRDRGKISAGRIDQIWLPLIEEYSHSPKKLLFGNGRFAIVSSDAVSRGIAADHMHPHNMYLEQMLDAGLIGLAVFMSFFILLFKKMLYFFNNIESSKLNEYYYAIIVSMISFFIAGLTGRSLFPGGKSCFFWIVVSLSIVIIRILQESKNSTEQLNS
jgi:O-antigen ligase